MNTGNTYSLKPCFSTGEGYAQMYISDRAGGRKWLIDWYFWENISRRWTQISTWEEEAKSCHISCTKNRTKNRTKRVLRSISNLDTPPHTHFYFMTAKISLILQAWRSAFSNKAQKSLNQFWHMDVDKAEEREEASSLLYIAWHLWLSLLLSGEQ